MTAARGSLAILVSFVSIAVLNYGFAIAMSWLLPVEQFGVLGIAQSVLLLGSTVVAAGFPWALAHLLAQTADDTARARAFRGALVGNLALGVAVGLAIALAALAGAVEPVGIYGPVLATAALTIAVLALNAILTGTLQGLLRLPELATVRLIEVILKALAGAVMVLAGFAALGAILGFLFGAVVATILAAILLRGFDTRSRPGRGDSGVFRAAGPIFVGMLGFAVVHQADILLLKTFTDHRQAEFLAGQYQVAVTLSRMPFFAAMALFGAIFPYVARGSGEGGTSTEQARLALKYAALFIVPTSVVLMSIPGPVVELFFSEKYDQSADVLALASLGSGLLAAAYACAILLQARGRPRHGALALTAAVAVQVIVSAIAVPALGMHGAAAGLAAGAALALIVLAPAAADAYGFRPTARGTTAYAIAIAVFAGLVTVLSQDGPFATVVSLAIASAAYAVVLVVLGLLTAHDVATLASGFGSRGEAWAGRLEHAARLFRGARPRSR